MGTRDKILDAAEVLFAEQGFTNTSMRTITSKAKVNLAAINYHFGTKEVLIQEVFVRILDILTHDLTKELNKLEPNIKGKQPTVEQILETFISSAININAKIHGGATLFMRLMGRSFAEPQLGYLRTFLSQRYKNLLDRYQELLQKALPDLPTVELFWRMHYVLGAAGFTLSGLDNLHKIAARDYSDDAPMEFQVRRLVPFLASGLQAPLCHNIGDQFVVDG